MVVLHGIRVQPSLVLFHIYFLPPWWLSWSRLFLHARDHLWRRSLSFDPGVGKILWRRKWQSTPVFLPREFHGQRSLAVCGPWVCKSQTQLSDHHCPEMCPVLTYCGNWCIFLLVAAIGHILIVQSVLRYQMTLGIKSECCLGKLILTFKQCLTIFFCLDGRKKK